MTIEITTLEGKKLFFKNQKKWKIEEKQWKKNKSCGNGRTKIVEIEFVTANPTSKQVQQKSTA